MRKVLVTGAGGFLGREVALNLARHGYLVRGMVRNHADIAALSAAGIEAVIADLKDEASLTAALTEIDTVFHIAALFRQAGLPADEFHRVNVTGTKNLLDGAIVAKVRSFIHCSTVGVLGHIENPPADESTPYNPGDPYQDSKTEGEKLVFEYLRDKRIRGSIIRPAMIYGPHDTRTLKLFKHIAEKRFFYVGPGNALVHFIDVRDLAEAFRLASETEAANGELFIIAGDRALPLNELVDIICEKLGVDKPWLHLPLKPMQMLGTLCETICTPFRINPPIFRRRVDFFSKDRSFNCEKARNILGFKPSQTLNQEISDIIDSYVSDGILRTNTPQTL